MHVFCKKLIICMFCLSSDNWETAPWQDQQQPQRAAQARAQRLRETGKHQATRLYLFFRPYANKLYNYIPKILNIIYARVTILILFLWYLIWLLFFSFEGLSQTGESRDSADDCWPSENASCCWRQRYVWDPLFLQKNTFHILFICLRGENRQQLLYSLTWREGKKHRMSCRWIQENW